MKQNRQKVLIVCCTHGDEHVGRFIFDNYPVGKNDFYEWTTIIGNPQAMYLNQRFVDTDLNRSFPGHKSSESYEERRAFQLTEKIKHFDIVIDIHGALCPQADSIILNQSGPEIDGLLEFLNPVHIVHNAPMAGLLVDQAKIGITLEYGFPEKHLDGYRRVETTIVNFLNKVPASETKKHYRYFGEVTTQQAHDNQLELINFRALSEAEKKCLNITRAEPIYPYFVGDESVSGLHADLLIDKNIPV